MAVSRRENPIKRLRSFIGEIPSLSPYQTQNGFAQLIQRTGQYVRVLESKGKISEKVAQQIEAATGVSASWLLDPGSCAEAIPAADGGELTADLLLSKINSYPKREKFPARAEIDPHEGMLDGFWAGCRPILLRRLRAGDSESFTQMLAILKSMQDSDD